MKRAVHGRQHSELHPQEKNKERMKYRIHSSKYSPAENVLLITAEWVCNTSQLNTVNYFLLLSIGK